MRMNKQACSVCQCDLIFHIDTIDDEEEDAGEVSSGEDEDDLWEDERSRRLNDSDDD